MDNILKTLYEHFYQSPGNIPEAERIKANHRTLIEHLSDDDRKLVLRIIDDKDLIREDISLDSFICGFWLAWQLANELNNYRNEHPNADSEVKPDALSIFLKEKSK